MIEDNLAAFLYILMRDKLPTSDVVECIEMLRAKDGAKTFVYTAHGLGEYAKDLANRIINMNSRL